MEHPHRLLEYAPSGRSACHGHCKSKIAEGELRFGTKVTVQDHDSVSWRCMSCVTHQQAENIRTLAANEKKTVHDFLTVPPPSSAGGEGPENDVVDLFVEYLEALHMQDGDAIKRLQRELSQHRKSTLATPEKKKRKNAQKLDTHAIDEQLRSDISLTHLFTVGDLRALCLHHHLDEKGTKKVLENRLAEFYKKV